MPTAHTADRRVLIASLTGTTIEFYDFYIYATAASLVLGELFFPAAAPGTQQLAAFATLAVAFFARPIGAVFFGHFGDRVGRKSTLVASLLTMGLSTVLIAALPGYATAGVWAPILLCVLRFGQGFGLGGEWGGAALLAVENAPPGWRARYGMAPQMGAPLGFIAANGLFLLLGAVLTPEQFREWGWRLPFAVSALLVGSGPLHPPEADRDARVRRLPGRSAAPRGAAGRAVPASLAAGDRRDARARSRASRSTTSPRPSRSATAPGRSAIP